MSTSTSTVGTNASTQGGIVSNVSFIPPYESRLENSSLKTVYRIVLEKDENGRIVVRCLDLPGVVTDGLDEREAIRNAFEAVQAMLESQGLKKEFNLIISRKFSA